MQQNNGRPAAAGGVGVGRWYAALPPVTRLFLTLAVVTGVAAHLGLVREANLAYTPDAVFLRGQLHRLLTTFAYVGRPGMSFVFLLHIHYHIGIVLELGHAGTRGTGSVRLAYLHVLAAGMLLAADTVFGLGLHFLSFSLHSAMTYYFGVVYPDAVVTVMGLIDAKAWQLIWWEVGFQVVAGGSVMHPAAGAAAGAAVCHLGLLESPPEWLRAVVLGGPPPPQDAAASKEGEEGAERAHAE